MCTCSPAKALWYDTFSPPPPATAAVSSAVNRINRFVSQAQQLSYKSAWTCFFAKWFLFSPLPYFTVEFSLPLLLLLTTNAQEDERLSVIPNTGIEVMKQQICIFEMYGLCLLCSLPSFKYILTFVDGFWLNILYMFIKSIHLGWHLKSRGAFNRCCQTVFYDAINKAPGKCQDVQTVDQKTLVSEGVMHNAI